MENRLNTCWSRFCLAIVVISLIFTEVTSAQTPTAEDYYTNGLQKLIAFKVTDNQQNLFDATNLFAQTLALEPNHAGAIIFDLITRALAISYDSDVNQMFTDFGISSNGRSIFNGTWEGPDSIPATTNTPSSGQIIAMAVAKLIPAIDTSLDRLGRIPASWSNTVMILTNELPIDNDVIIDAGDVQMVQAGLEAFKAFLMLINAYNFDINFGYFEHVPTPTATISVDGLASDWSHVPALFTDNRNDSSGSRNTDIRSVRTAMDSANVYLMVETYTAPINPTATIEVNVNCKPGRAFLQGDFDDLQLNINPSNVLAWTGSSTNLVSYPLPNAYTKRGSVVEVSIPRSQLGNPTYFEPTFVNIWTNSHSCDPSTLEPPRTTTNFFATFPAFFTATNAASMSIASNAIDKAIDFYMVAAGLIRSSSVWRTNNLIAFDPTGLDDVEAEAQVRHYLGKVKSSLQGSVRLDVEGVPGFHEHMNLSQLFVTPYLTRSMLPKFTKDDEAVPGSFIDPTFNGVMPDMTKAKLTHWMLGAAMYQALGIVSPDNRSWFLVGTNISIDTWMTERDPGYQFMKVELFAGARKIGTATADPSGFSWSNSPSFMWTNAPAGKYAMTVRGTDSRNRVSRSDPVSITVSLPPPDFTITGISLAPAIPSYGGTFTASVKVKNQGAAAGNGGTLAIWANRSAEAAVGAPRDKSVAIGMLNVNEEKTFTIAGIKAGTAGSKVFRAMADASNITAESNETNNQLTLGYTVVAP